MTLKTQKTDYALKSLIVFLVLVIVASLTFGARPFQSDLIPLFNSGRGFIFAALLTLGFSYLPALFLASITVAKCFNGLLSEFAVHSILTGWVTLLLSVLIHKKLISGKNPVDKISDWLKFSFLVVPFYFLIKTFLDITLEFTLKGDGWWQLWKNYLSWTFVDALGISLTAPLSLYVINFLRQTKNSRLFFLNAKGFWITNLICALMTLLFFNDLMFLGFGITQPTYFLLGGLLIIAVFCGPLEVSAAVCFQGLIIAWTKLGQRDTMYPFDFYSIDELRLFLWILSVFLPIVAILIVRKNKQSLESLQKLRLSQGLDSSRLVAAGISHDLDEPLRNVIQSLSVVERGFADAQTQGFLDGAVVAAKRARVMVNSYLDFVRIETHDLAETEFHSRELLNEVLSIFQVEIDRIGAKVFLHDLPKVKADRDLIFRVFQNMISNSLKYKSHRNLEIKISATTIGQSNCFVFADNGIGFDRQHAQGIFDIFRRLHTFSEIEGYGVGLAISKRIIELHGGNIWAEGEPGIASRFYFTLPIKK